MDERNTSVGLGWVQAAIVLGLGLGLGCARRIEEQTKAAFDGAQTNATEPSKDKGTTRRPTEQRAPEVDESRGRRRIDTALAEAVETLQSGDPNSLARLARQWCSQEPEPQSTDSGEVWVCFPEPPVQTAGQGFTLELGGTGMVGLVSSSLSGADSRRVMATALEAVQRLCVEPWQVVSGDDESAEEVHTCKVTGGPILAVGRLPRDIEADLWQVSVTLLAAT